MIFFFEVVQYSPWMWKSSPSHPTFEILLFFQAWYTTLRSWLLPGHRKAPKLLEGCPFSTSLGKSSIRFNLYCLWVEKSKDKDKIPQVKNSVSKLAMTRTKSIISVVCPEESCSFTDFLLSTHQNRPNQWYRLIHNH